MNQKQIEKLLKRIADTNDELAVTQMAIAETNAQIVEVILDLNIKRVGRDVPPTM
jgi:hypothetical protein